MPIQIKNNYALTQSIVGSLLSYDPESGLFTWKKIPGSTNHSCGMIAGTADTAGYWNIKLQGRTYKAHRLAWLYIYGVWPDGELDHINRQRSDNRVANLRESTHADNIRELGLFKNNLSGVRGVFHDKSRDRYRARVSRDGKQRYLGTYRTAAEAEARYLAETASANSRG